MNFSVIYNAMIKEAKGGKAAQKAQKTVKLGERATKLVEQGEQLLKKVKAGEIKGMSAQSIEKQLARVKAGDTGSAMDALSKAVSKATGSAKSVAPTKGAGNAAKATSVASKASENVKLLPAPKGKPKGNANSAKTPDVIYGSTSEKSPVTMSNTWDKPQYNMAAEENWLPGYQPTKVEAHAQRKLHEDNKIKAGMDAVKERGYEAWKKTRAADAAEETRSLPGFETPKEMYKIRQESPDTAHNFLYGMDDSERWLPGLAPTGKDVDAQFDLTAGSRYRSRLDTQRQKEIAEKTKQMAADNPWLPGFGKKRTPGSWKKPVGIGVAATGAAGVGTGVGLGLAGGSSDASGSSDTASLGAKSEGSSNGGGAAVTPKETKSKGQVDVAKDYAKQYKPELIGAGAGLAGAGGLYALSGAIPAMKKKKLLRAMTALAGGAGIGYGAYALSQPKTASYKEFKNSIKRG